MKKLSILFAALIMTAAAVTLSSCNKMDPNKEGNYTLHKGGNISLPQDSTILRNVEGIMLEMNSALISRFGQYLYKRNDADAIKICEEIFNAKKSTVPSDKNLSIGLSWAKPIDLSEETGFLPNAEMVLVKEFKF